jgi:hypothetical protein
MAQVMGPCASNIIRLFRVRKKKIGESSEEKREGISAFPFEFLRSKALTRTDPLLSQFWC